MTKEELIEALRVLATNPVKDKESDHIAADALLLKYINDPVVTKIWMKIKKWYA